MEYFKVKIDQAGGKYGNFKCPRCGQTALFKFTAASGWCDFCGASYLKTTMSVDLTDAEKANLDLIG